MPHRKQKDIDELKKSIDKLFSSPSTKQSIIAGDFNCPNINWDTLHVPPNSPDRQIQSNLIDTMNNNYTQIHNEPTREQNILDLVFVTNPSLVKSSISIPGISDHSAIVTDIDIKPTYNKQQKRKIYKYAKADWDKIKEDCDTISSDVKTLIENGSNINDVWEKFKTSIINSMDKNIPSFQTNSKSKTPWINGKIKKMLRKKQRLYSKAKRTKNWSNYKHQQKITKSEIRKAEYNYVNNIIEEGLRKNDSKPFWRYIKSRRQDSIGVAPLKEKGLLISDSLPKANLLLKQFQSVFSKDDSVTTFYC